jgi:hypothetical protein
MVEAPMARRIRWLVLIAMAVIVAGLVMVVVSVQPGLSDARDRVDTRWEPLRVPLALRYKALKSVAQALNDAGAGERAVTKELDATLARWSELALRGPKHTEPDVEAKAANDLEALARRARANVAASARLAPNPAITAAFTAYDQVVVDPTRVRPYNRAVRAYEDEREGTMNRVVATVLGYDARPRLVLGL